MWKAFPSYKSSSNEWFTLQPLESFSLFRPAPGSPCICVIPEKKRVVQSWRVRTIRRKMYFE